MTDKTAETARDDAQQIIGKAIRYAVLMGYAGVNPLREAENAIAALAEAGLVIMSRERLIDWHEKAHSFADAYGTSYQLADDIDATLADRQSEVGNG